jgi:methylated-DNA-[protein]-cysteine S-methyltransferase
MNIMKAYFDNIDTPLGIMEVVATDNTVKSIHFVEFARPINTNKVTDLVVSQLTEYFDGERKIFDLPLDADGTNFQKRVWMALLNIPHGQTCTYGDIAKEIGNPKGMRAVGLANGKNPMTIVVPCHRVIGANGKLTGYASGTERKAWLLSHESDSLF